MEKRIGGTRRIAVGLTAALMVVQTGMMHAGLRHLTGIGQAIMLSALFTAIYAGTLALVIRWEKPQSGMLIFTGVFLAVTMLARTAMLDFVTADYNAFINPWVKGFRISGTERLARAMGDYNLMYQYLMLLVSRCSIKDLYLVKLLTVIFDYALALVMMRAAGHFAGKKAALPVLLTVAVMPTVLINGACWGQCDSIYVFAVILSLYMLKTDRPVIAAAAISVAFAFKLQAIFFFPIVLMGLLHREFKLRHALVFVLTYLVTMLPALLAGRPFLDALSVYARQSVGQYYDRLTYHAPNVYVFFPMMEFANKAEGSWMRYIPGVEIEAANPYLRDWLLPMLQDASLYACILLTLLVVVYWLLHWQEVTPEMTLAAALFFAIFLPYVMPKMHERYFFMADMLSVLYAAKYSNRRFMPLLVAGASLLSYFPYLMRQIVVDERLTSLMMLAALLIVGHDLLVQMRRNRKGQTAKEAV